MVVEDDGIAVAIVLADPSETGPNRGDGRWPKDRRAHRLIEDLITFVHHLNVLGQPYGAVGIRRRAIASDARKWNAVKIEAGRRYVRDQDLEQTAAVDNRVRRVNMQGQRQFGI